MSESNLLAPWVRRFLVEYLVTVRCMARSTQLSYRDTLAKVIRYAAHAVGKRPDLLNVDDLSRELITQFLPSTASNKDLAARTINQRLAALHTFARFVGKVVTDHGNDAHRNEEAGCQGEVGGRASQYLVATPLRCFDRVVGYRAYYQL